MTQMFTSNDASGDPIGRPAGIGIVLRQRRDELAWQLADIAGQLRIKPEYLAALERGDIGALPGPAYATGFLKAYADFLGLDGAELLRRFKNESAALHAKPELTFPMPLTDRGIPGSGLVMVVVILLSLGYGTWWYAASGTDAVAPAVEPVPARLLAAPVLEPPRVTPDSAAAAEPAPPPEPVPAQVAALPVPSLDSADPHVYGNPSPGPVMVKATADTWVEVLDNNHSIWNRLLKAGDVYNPPKDGLVLRTGNAGGIQIVVNGKTLPPVGNTGEVRKIELDPAKLGG